MVFHVVSSVLDGNKYRNAAPVMMALVIGAGLCTPAGALVISEIAFNPGANGSADDVLEFVEIYNDAPTVADLSGCYFARGIDFVFPEDTFLKARGAIAVCANVAAMKARHPDANLIGDFSGRLDNGGEGLTLVTPSGSPLATASYRDRSPWPAGADGTGFTLALVSPFADAADAASWVRSAQRGGTPGLENFPPPAIVDNEIFPETGPAATWRVRKGFNTATQTPEAFSSPATAWREAGFDDSSWVEAQAPIGFGEPEIITVLDDMDGKYGSFALRKRIDVSQPLHDEMLSLTLALRVDDGYVAYFNGQEIGRIGFTSPAGTDVGFDELTNVARELKSARPILLTIPRQNVLVGANVLAVQVHNRTLTGASSDAGFVAALTYQTRVVYAPLPETTVVINEVISRAAPGARGVELHNTLNADIALEGWSIALGPEKGGLYTLPAGSMLAARGFLFVPESTLGFVLAGPELTVLLFEPDGVTPADALALTDPAEIPASPQSHVRFPDGDATLWVATAVTPGAPNTVAVEKDIVINEVHYNPKLLLPSLELDPDADKGEFIELYNRSDRTISLAGYRFVSGYNFDFPPGAALAGKSYLVLSRDPRRIREVYGLGADKVFGPSDTAGEEELSLFGALRNRGERIRLVDALGNTVDEVTYRSEGQWDELADGGGSSLELIDPHQDNTSPHAWIASDETRRTAWTELKYTARNVASLVPAPQESELHVFLLSEGEILLDAVSVTQGDPPAERVPNGDFETEIRTPWRLIGTHVRSVRRTDEAKSGSACLHLIATGSGDNRVNRAEVDLNPVLANADVTVTLWARWLKGSHAIHVSGHNNAFGKTLYLPVPQDAGTPGRENTARTRLRELTGSDNLGPVISGVQHSPAVPLGLVPIQFKARVTDSDGVAMVEVLHQKDGTAAFEKATLFDDGQHDDGAALDGLYSGEIAGYASRSLVNFYVSATDSGGRTRVYPTRAPERTLLFATDDKFDAALWRYRLLINQKELNTPVTGLARRLLHSDELVRGTFVFEESEVYYDVGVRYRGSPWNRPPDPKMFRVRFNGDKPFVDGVKRINISRYGSVQNEGIAYQLLAKAGRQGVTVPYSPRYTYINMKYNTVPHGSGALSEIRPIDADYMSFNWPNDADGQAWKITGKLAFSDAGTMAGGGPDWTVLRAYPNGPYAADVNSPENYRFYFNPTVKLDLDEFKPIIELLKVMDRTTTPDAGYDDAIAGILNVEATLRVYAVRAMLADWDTVDIGNGQNAYLYYAPIEGRHYLVPWDMDHTFERAGEAIVPGASTNGLRRLINRPVYKRQYARILQELNRTSWSDAYLNNWTRLVSETGTPGRVAPATGLVGFIRNRRTMVDNFLRSGINIPFAVTSPNPTGAPSESVPIHGTAGIEVAFIYYELPGGELTEMNTAWSTPPRQTSAIPSIWQGVVNGVKPGKTDVDLLAFDREGNLVGSTRTSVYNTTGWAAPAVTSIEPPTGPRAGGTAVTVRGSGFQEGLTIKLGGKPATEVTVISPGEASATTPAADAAGAVDVAAVNIDLIEGTLPGGFTYTEGLPFRRGEVDGDGNINTTDVVVMLNYLFREGALSCIDAADINDDGKTNITDPIVLLRHLFQGGEAPAAPFEAAGFDTTADDLTCGT